MLRALLCLLIMAFGHPALADSWSECTSGGADKKGIIAACSTIIDNVGESTDRRAEALKRRAWARHDAEQDYPRAIADLSSAVDLAPGNCWLYFDRAILHTLKGQFALAAADFATAARLCPREPVIHANLCDIFWRLQDFDSVLDSCSRSIALNEPTVFAAAFSLRGMAREKKGDIAGALADLKESQRHHIGHATQRWMQEQARDRLAALGSVAATKSTPAAPPATGRRVALVIGNSKYEHAGVLANPANDAGALAATLRRIGFSEVIERVDLTLAQLSEALKSFGDLAETADWAVIYFAGHGIEMNGTAYIVPVDARLKRDTHVLAETIELNRVLETVRHAKRLRLAILDACRDNPFLAQMARSAGAARSVGRGLPSIEPAGNVLVAYASKHGTIAQDGPSGGHSPFAKALLDNIAVPSLELRLMFGKVRDAVMQATNNRQEPFIYGSVGGEALYFKQ